MKIKIKFLILPIIFSFTLISAANADIYQLPKKHGVYENTASEELTEDLTNSQKVYKVKPIDSGYEYEAPTSSEVKTDLVNKNFVAASKTFTIGPI